MNAVSAREHQHTDNYVFIFYKIEVNKLYGLPLYNIYTSESVISKEQNIFTFLTYILYMTSKQFTLYS